MISTKVDQFTLTILPSLTNLEGFAHISSDYSEYVRNRFEELLQIVPTYSSAELMNGGVRNYDTVYAYGFEKAKIFFKYSSSNVSNGISIEFKARALREYLKAYRIKKRDSMDVHKILSLLADEFDIRLSRLDIAIDFVDEDVLVTKIYDDLLSEELIIKNKGNRIITDDKIRTIGNSGVIQTIYVNSRKGDSFMRIYNKKEESIINNNIDMQRALECSNWTRFELELKGTYAHNATKALIDCERNNENYLSLLFGMFVQFFKFYNILGYDEYGNYVLEHTGFYQNMIDTYFAQSPAIDGHKTNKADEFSRKYSNLFNNGTMTFFRMYKEVYGENELDELLNKIKEDIEGIKLNKDHETMIKAHEETKPFFK